MYPQVAKLCQLVLTIPATSDRSTITLKRIKTFLGNTMTNERLSSLSSLAIEKTYLPRWLKIQFLWRVLLMSLPKKKKKKIAKSN